MRKFNRVLGCVLAITALPVHAAGLQPGRIEDTREDVLKAAQDAQGVADLARYENRIVVLAPPEPVSIPIEQFVLPTAVPEPVHLTVAEVPDLVVPLFVFGGLVALPLLLGGGGGGGGAIGAPPVSQVPSVPGEVPTPPVPPVTPPTPGPIPEPATWAMLLLGFAAVGAGLRLSRRSSGRSSRPVPGSIHSGPAACLPRIR